MLTNTQTDNKMIKDTFLDINQKLVLPDLSDKLGLTATDFVVRDIFQGGMGTCAKIQSADSQFFALNTENAYDCLVGLLRKQLFF